VVALCHCLAWGQQRGGGAAGQQGSWGGASGASGAGPASASGQFRGAHTPTHLFLGNLSRRIIISNILRGWGALKKVKLNIKYLEYYFSFFQGVPKKVEQFKQ